MREDSSELAGARKVLEVVDAIYRIRENSVSPIEANNRFIALIRDALSGEYQRGLEDGRVIE